MKLLQLLARFQLRKRDGGSNQNAADLNQNAAD
jgi:hypothetical protein